MAKYRCPKCKKILTRDAREKPRRGRRTLRSYCTKTGKDAIIRRLDA